MIYHFRVFPGSNGSCVVILVQIIHAHGLDFSNSNRVHDPSSSMGYFFYFLDLRALRSKVLWISWACIKFTRYAERVQ